MTALRPLTAICAVLALAACDVEQTTTIEEAPVATETAQVAEAPASGASPELSAAAQFIANDFAAGSGQNLGNGFIIDDVEVDGPRVTIEYQAPVAGRLYRNSGTNSDPWRRSFRRANCSNDAISAFLLLGGEVMIILEGRDNVRIGTYLYNRPCS